MRTYFWYFPEWSHVGNRNCFHLGMCVQNWHRVLACSSSKGLRSITDDSHVAFLIKILSLLCLWRFGAERSVCLPDVPCSHGLLISAGVFLMIRICPYAVVQLLYYTRYYSIFNPNVRKNAKNHEVLSYSKKILWIKRPRLWVEIDQMRIKSGHMVKLHTGLFTYLLAHERLCNRQRKTCPNVPVVMQIRLLKMRNTVVCPTLGCVCCRLLFPSLLITMGECRGRVEHWW